MSLHFWHYISVHSAHRNTISPYTQGLIVKRTTGNGRFQTAYTEIEESWLKRNRTFKTVLLSEEKLIIYPLH